MISYLLLFFSLLIFLFPIKEKSSNNSLYATVFGAFSFAQFLLGFISLLLINTGNSKFPILIISTFIFLLSLVRYRQSFNKLRKIKNFLEIEIHNLTINNGDNKFKNFKLYLLAIILFLIFISSFGPINHPDAADYHVGYPYQYFIRGGFFIDGGMHQALLGLADYANLAFIQENTIWFIRTVQVVNLPFIVLFLSNKVKNNILILTFLTVPTFIQWSTIGKPLFLGESSLIILYLIWSNKKTSHSLKLLVLSAIGCISFKISSLLIIFPIFLIYALNILLNLSVRENIYSDIKYTIKSKEFLIAVLILFYLLITRYIISGNFIYSLLTNIFNKDDILVSQFSNYVSNYGRDNLFFLRIFIPINSNSLSTAFGPTIFILTVTVFIKAFKSNFLKNEIFLVTFGQLIFLLLFCQGRSDYYIAPLILIIYLSNENRYIFNNSNLRLLYLFSIFLQILIFSIFISLSIYLNFNSATNFNQVMTKTAYGFNFSKYIKKSIPGNALIMARNTRLYYPENYVDIDNFKKCLINKNSPNLNNNKVCLQKYKVNQAIIVNKNETIDENEFSCKTINGYYPSRRFLFRKKLDFKYCEKLNFYK